MLAFGALWGLLDLDDVLTLHKIDLDAIHIRGERIHIAQLCIIQFLVSVRRLKRIRIFGFGIDGIFRATLLRILHAQVNNHFVFSRFGNGHTVKNKLCGNLIFGNIPVLDSLRWWGADTRPGKIISCPNVNAVFESIKQLGREIVNVFLTIAISIIYRGDGIQRNGGIATTRANAVFVDVFAYGRNHRFFGFAASGTSCGFFTVLKAGNFFGDNRFPINMLTRCRNGGVFRMTAHRTNKDPISGFNTSGRFPDMNLIPIFVRYGCVNGFFFGLTARTGRNRLSRCCTSGLSDNYTFSKNMLVLSFFRSGLLGSCFFGSSFFRSSFFPSCIINGCLQSGDLEFSF